MSHDNNETQQINRGRKWNGGDRINPTFADAEVYMIKCRITGEAYVGSTKYGIERIHSHKSNSGDTNAKVILDRNDYEVSVLEKYPCDDKYALTEREHHHICILRGAGVVVVNKFHPPIHPNKRADYYKEYHRQYHRERYEPSYGTILQNLMTTEEEKQEKKDAKREANIEYLREYRNTMTDEQRERQKQLVKEHYERVKDTEEYKERRKKWEDEHKEEMKEYNRVWAQNKRDNDPEFKRKEAEKALERYHRNKEAIVARRREKIECPDCGKELSRASLRLHKKAFHS